MSAPETSRSAERAERVEMITPAPDDDSSAPIRSRGGAQNAGVLALFSKELLVPAVLMIVAIGGSWGFVALVYVLVTLAVIHIALEVAARVRERRRGDRDRRAPFERDHPWARDGEERAALRGAFTRLGGVLNVALVSALAWMYFRDIAPVVVGALVLVAWAVISLRAGTAARVRVTYLARPYVIGDRLVVRIGLSDVGSAVSSMDVTLRCVEENLVPNPRRYGGDDLFLGRSTLWSAVARLPVPQLVPAPGSDVDLVFEPPAGLPGTALSHQPATYWEVHVAVNGDALTHEYRFLLPVYDARSTVERRAGPDPTAAR